MLESRKKRERDEGARLVTHNRVMRYDMGHGQRVELMLVEVSRVVKRENKVNGEKRLTGVRKGKATLFQQSQCMCHSLYRSMGGMG